MRRIAVIQTAFPGDVILCTPVFESLKSAGHHVTAVIRPQAEPLVRNNPNIDNLICYDKKKGAFPFFKAISDLKKAECDTALIVQRYFKSGLLPLYAGISRRIGFDASSVSFLYTDEVRYKSKQHEVERCLSLCEGLSSTKGFSPQIFLTENDRGEALEIITTININPDNFIVIAPGSVWATKRWTGYNELISLLKEKTDFDIVLLGSDDDFKLCEQINIKGHAVNLAGKTDLLQSAAIINQSRITVTNDSAPAHIAAAVGTPVVAVFGPTVPAFGFAPYSEKSSIVENPNLNCRPCSSHGPQKCPEKHFRCMKEISPEQVWEKCKILLDIK